MYVPTAHRVALQLCIDQTNDETKAAGVAGFKRFLGKCDKMVALISENYFERLWCVYELVRAATT